MINEIKENELYFARKSDNVKLPSKKSHNAGYDIYAYFDEDYITIEPHETRMIPTGLYSACNENYYIQLVERGSTGTKGIGQRCGVIDSSYRGEWFVPITNHNNVPIVILKSNADTYKIRIDSIVYPYEKAISQAVILPVPKMEVKEISISQLISIPSERGDGCLGSSEK